MQKIDRTGEENINKQGLKMQIIRYKNVHDIDIQFEDGIIVRHTYYQYFKKGNIMNYNIPTYLGVGYRGYGPFKTKVGVSHTEEYTKCGSMLTRCYSDKYIKNQNYIDCYVCDEWKNYQNFAKWYSEHKYVLSKDDSLELDKDIKVIGNKIYSPDTCLLLPHRLNTIVLDRKNDRGNYALGVQKIKSGAYIASCNGVNGEKIYLGRFESEEEASNSYNIAKKKIIEIVVKQYKNIIPDEVYDAVMKYKEICYSARKLQE